MTGSDPDRLWSGQRAGLCGKPCACEEQQAAPKETSLKRGSQLLCKDLAHSDLLCTGSSRAQWLGL